MYRCQVVLTRKEKESVVIKLAEEGKRTRDITQDAHFSLKDIGAISRIIICFGAFKLPLIFTMPILDLLTVM